jgi:hypothetical protein
LYLEVEEEENEDGDGCCWGGDGGLGICGGTSETALDCLWIGIVCWFILFAISVASNDSIVTIWLSKSISSPTFGMPPLWNFLSNELSEQLNQSGGNFQSFRNYLSIL